MLKDIWENIQNDRSLPNYPTANKFVPGSGNPNANIVFVGEAPGEVEDETGIPFTGPSGKLLNDTLFNLDVGRSDVYVTNVLKWRPPNNRKPYLSETRQFGAYLWQELISVNPQIIVCLGRSAFEAFFGPRQRLDFYDTYVLSGFNFVTVYHPSYVLRNLQIKDEWTAQIKEVVDKYGI